MAIVNTKSAPTPAGQPSIGNAGGYRGTRAARVCLPLAAILLVYEPVSADTTAVEAGDPAAEAGTTAVETGTNVDPNPSLTRISEQYEREILQLESTRGVYDPFLGENLSSLGLIYRQMGKFDQAVEAYQRSMQIRRVNDGLQSLGQISILEKIIDANIGAGNWEDLDQNYRQLLWVYKRNYEYTNPQLLKVLLLYGQWKIQIFRNSLLGDKSTLALSDANELFSGYIRQLEKQVGETDPLLLELLYMHAMINYHQLINTANKPLSDFKDSLSRESSPRVTYQQACQTVRGSDGLPRTYCYSIPIVIPGNQNTALLDAQTQKDMELRRHQYDVRRNLDQIIRIYEQGEDLSPMDTLFDPVDWNANRGRNRSAMEIYREARNFMDQIGISDKHIDDFFGTPPVDATESEPVPGNDPDDTQAASSPPEGENRSRR